MTTSDPTSPLERLKTGLAGRYRVLDELGAGGMAVVFLAEDVKHGRKVALKVLRQELAAILGGERFLKEIEVTANLQHPNILPLYDSGEVDGFLYYVMPLAEGETLREKLDREGQLPVDEAVAIARSVAAALDYAHRRGVIHRDIKPSNILIHDGQALVADFGIALAMKNAGSDTRLTETGLSIGTPHYMSPEQAAGDRELGAQSDLYSLGAVTYEMLVGEPPHVGKSAQAVVAKILSDTPAPIGRTRELIPPNVEAAVRKALARSPADRFKSAADFGEALTNPSFTLPSLLAAGTAQGRWAKLGPVAAGVALGMALLAAWGWMRSESRPVVSRFEISLEGVNPRFLPSLDQEMDVAPDGSWILFREASAPWRFMVRYRDQLEPVPLAGVDSAFAPRVSPDGDRVAFIDFDNMLRIMPADGGPSVTVADSVWNAVWLDDGALAFDFDGDGIRLVDATGGEETPLWSAVDAGLGVQAIAPLPDRRGLLLSVSPRDNGDEMEIHVLDLESGEARPLFPAVSAHYVSLGYVIFVRSDGAVLAAPLDLDRLELTGPAVPITDGIATNGRMAGLRVGADGTALMALGPSTSITTGRPRNRQLVSVSRTGEMTTVDPSWRFASGAPYGGLSLSPDGRRLAIALIGEDGNEDIWVKELPDGPLTRLTYDPSVEARPAWMPDSERVVFLSGLGNPDSSRVQMRRADGAGGVSDLLKTPGLPASIDIGADGSWAVVRIGGAANEVNIRDVYGFRLDGDTSAVPLLTETYDEAMPKISPDGRWLAYNSDESGRMEVYVRPFPGVESAKFQVSVDGGMQPLWNRAHNEIVYVFPADDASEVLVYAARYETSPTFRVTEREHLFTLTGVTRPQGRSDDFVLTPDGQHILTLSTTPVASSDDDGEPNRLVIVQNWLEEVRRILEREGG